MFLWHYAKKCDTLLTLKEIESEWECAHWFSLYKWKEPSSSLFAFRRLKDIWVCSWSCMANWTSHDWLVLVTVLNVHHSLTVMLYNSNVLFCINLSRTLSGIFYDSLFLYINVTVQKALWDWPRKKDFHQLCKGGNLSISNLLVLPHTVTLNHTIHETLFTLVNAYKIICATYSQFILHKINSVQANLFKWLPYV